MRQSEVRQIRNKKRKALLKEALKGFSQNKSMGAFLKTQSLLDRAAKWGIIKENKAARLKSKLAKLLPKKVPRPKTKEKEGTKRRKKKA